MIIRGVKMTIVLDMEGVNSGSQYHDSAPISPTAGRHGR